MYLHMYIHNIYIYIHTIIALCIYDIAQEPGEGTRVVPNSNGSIASNHIINTNDDNNSN